MNAFNQAAVYWIRLPEHTDIASQGYVGVSKNPEKRLQSHLKKSKNHTRDNNHLYHSIRKYSWEKLIKETILYGEESYCYETEMYLRPISNVGWNIRPGGNGLPTKKADPVFWNHREKSKEQKYVEWTQTDEYAEEEFQHQWYLKEQQRQKEWKEELQKEVYQQYFLNQKIKSTLPVLR